VCVCFFFFRIFFFFSPFFFSIGSSALGRRQIERSLFKRKLAPKSSPPLLPFPLFFFFPPLLATRRTQAGWTGDIENKGAYLEPGPFSMQSIHHFFLFLFFSFSFFLFPPPLMRMGSSRPHAIIFFTRALFPILSPPLFFYFQPHWFLLSPPPSLFSSLSLCPPLHRIAELKACCGRLMFLAFPFFSSPSLFLSYHQGIEVRKVSRACDKPFPPPPFFPFLFFFISCDGSRERCNFLSFYATFPLPPPPPFPPTGGSFL